VKYVIVIMDGAAGWPLPEMGNLSCLELAKTPNLDALAREGRLGLARTVPAGMEPSSACACMSVMGYDPTVYYRGRSAIEAKSMGIPIASDEVVFRCNLVSVRDGQMASYSAGHIGTPEAKELIEAVQQKLGSDTVHFYPGVNYRHILKLKDHGETLQAVCTPPHDIPNKQAAGFLPSGPGSDFLRDLMKKSETVLRDHPVNKARQARGEAPATTIWLFWSSGQIPEMPQFRKAHGLNAVMTSGVDLLRGLAIMAGIKNLEIQGVTDGPDNNFAGQADGALAALSTHDLAFIHVEAPDEAGHAGSVKQKVEAIEKIDNEILGRVRYWRDDTLRVLVMPDHPTPIKIKTHNDEPVPFLLWGPGFNSNGAGRFSERDAKYAGLLIDNAYTIMDYLTGKD
jgi:2,3-bisphosphoglycerate-independent phosphoglycerate mutase